MAEPFTDGIWTEAGPIDCVELPISAALSDRIRAWAEWNMELDDDAWVRSGEEEMHWERIPGAPVAAFNAEAHAIAEALRAELPGWDIAAVEVDAWLR